MVAQSGLIEKFSYGEYDFTQLEIYRKFENQELELFWGPAKLWYDTPSKIGGAESELVASLSAFLEQVNESMILISPYFVPTEEGTQELIDAVQRGKEIVIVTNSLASNDVFAVHGWYAKYREALIEAGIEIWEVKASADVGNQWSLTGSSRSSFMPKQLCLIKESSLLAR